MNKNLHEEMHIADCFRAERNKKKKKKRALQFNNCSEIYEKQMC